MPSGSSMAVASAEANGTRPGGPSPSLARVRELARDHNLIPLHQTFIDDCQTPVSAYLKLRDPTHPSFLLESAEQGRVGRYSFIGFRPRKVLRWSLGDEGDPYALAAEELRRFRVAPLPDCRRSRAAPSACSPMTSCARSSRWASPTPIRSVCPTWP